MTSLSPPFYSGANGEDLNKSASSLETPAFDRKDQWLTDRMNFLDDATGITARDDGREAVDDSRKPSLTAEDTKAIQNMQDFKGQYAVPPLRTTRSFSKLVSKTPDTWDRRWPRHMSWTAMVDVLAAAAPSDITDSDNIATRTNAGCALAFENSLAMEGRVMDQRLEALKTLETVWVEEKVHQIEAYDEQARRDQTNADLVYHQKYDEYNALHNASDDLLTEERANLTEAIKDVENLGG